VTIHSKFRDYVFERRTSEIAAELFVSPATVQRHVANIYAKLGLRNRAEATAYALNQGLSAERHGDPAT
jgi:predicted transcriptional regulator